MKTKAKTTSVRTLRRLRPPPDLRHRGRIPGVETTTFRIRAALLKMKVEEDDDIHLVVGQPGSPKLTMIVEFPSLSCTRGATTSTRAKMRNARTQLVQRLRRPTRRTSPTSAARRPSPGSASSTCSTGRPGSPPTGSSFTPFSVQRESPAIGRYQRHLRPRDDHSARSTPAPATTTCPRRRQRRHHPYDRRDLRPHLPGRVHPAAAARPRLQRRPIQELPSDLQVPAPTPSLRRRPGRGRIEG